MTNNTSTKQRYFFYFYKMILNSWHHWLKIYSTAEWRRNENTAVTWGLCTVTLSWCSHTFLHLQCKSSGGKAALQFPDSLTACWRWLPHLSVSSRRCSWCRSLNSSKALTTDWLQIREGSRFWMKEVTSERASRCWLIPGVKLPLMFTGKYTPKKKNVTQRSNFLKSPSSTTGRRCTTTSVCVHEWSKNMSQQIWKNRQEVAATRLGI